MNFLVSVIALSGFTEEIGKAFSGISPVASVTVCTGHSRTTPFSGYAIRRYYAEDNRNRRQNIQILFKVKPYGGENCKGRLMPPF